MKSLLAAALLLAALPARGAVTLVCPEAATAVQVGTCPSEEELRYTFNGFCSDDRRLYARDTDTCASYENYRREKNIALWESADGTFQAYLSCDLPAGTLHTLRPVTMTITRQGKLTRIACNYGRGVLFTHRTKLQCRLEGRGECRPQAPCTAVCE